MGAPLDLTGLKVNKLLVLEKTNQRTASGCIKWKCKCDCGNFINVDSSRLKSGAAKSCGCLSKAALEYGRELKFKDLSGQKFGKLTVIKRIEDAVLSSGVNKVQYQCICDCGNTVNVLADNLRQDNTRSCGKCNVNSHGNLKIDELLTEANIPFKREYKFLDCKDKMPLPFDFYVNNQYLIEFDGKQHYGKGGSWGDINYLDIVQKHDEIKNHYCKAHNIPLIRIPYTQLQQLTLNDLKLETSQFII